MLAGEGRRFYGHDHSHQKSDSEPVRRTQYYHQQACDDVCAAAVIREEHSVRQKHRPEDPDDQKALRRSGHDAGRILLHAGV